MKPPTFFFVFCFYIQPSFTIFFLFDAFHYTNEVKRTRVMLYFPLCFAQKGFVFEAGAVTDVRVGVGDLLKTLDGCK